MFNSSREESNFINKSFLEDNFKNDPSAHKELEEIYSQISGDLKSGELVKGKIVSKETKGIFIDIEYKSNGFISSSEFLPSEYADLSVGDTIEIMIDILEDSEGDLVLSYQKAKSLKVWNDVTKISEEGGVVTGVVTGKVKGGLNVDIGIPAFLPGSQIDIQRVLDFDQYLGQEVTCKILKINKKRGNAIISRRKFLEEEKNEFRKKSLENLDVGKSIKGKVKNITSYGAFIDIGGIDGLLHVTDMSWGRIVHPNEMLEIGDEVDVKILSFDKEHAKISLGMKQLNDNPWQDIEGRFPVGKKVEGKISSIMDYGLFVEVSPGVEGLVHISEISWTERVQDLNTRYKVGDAVQVAISSLDKNERRMSLSIKRLDDDPWRSAFDKFKPGDVIEGTVSNVADFGVFVRILQGVDGLVHISDISWVDHVEDPSKKYKIGDSIKVIVLAIEQDKRRISLGIKQLNDDPWSTIEKDFSVGKLVKGKISKVTSFGVFVRFESGVEGLAHVSELANHEISDIASFLPVGSERTFRVVKASSVDRKLGLSLKKASEDSSHVADTSDRRADSSNRNFYKKSGDRSSSAKGFVDQKPSQAKGSLQIALENAMKSDDESVSADKEKEAVDKNKKS